MSFFFSAVKTLNTSHMTRPVQLPLLATQSKEKYVSPLVVWFLVVTPSWVKIGHFDVSECRRYHFKSG